MNRFLFKPNLRPELKMVQPLPAYSCVLAERSQAAGRMAAAGSRLEVQPRFPLTVEAEAGAAVVRMGVS
jgi:hypothetical protein